MKIKYETSTATFTQFIALSLLGIANALNQTITTCVKDSSECVTGAMLSIIFFILTVLFFAGVWVLGYTVQDKRSPRLAQLLIIVELIILPVAMINARGHSDLLSLFTSLTDIVLAAWVIYSAILLIKHGGKRVVRKRSARSRNRR